MGTDLTDNHDFCEMRPCKICKGGTAEILCPDCDGHRYEFDVEGNTEDCERCDGDGFLSADECPFCCDGYVGINDISDFEPEDDEDDEDDIKL